MIERGLPKFATIRASVALLSRAIASGLLARPSSAEPLRPEKRYQPTDPILSVQRIASEIAARYDLKVRLINVSFSSAMPCAGRVELGPGEEFFVEIHSEHKESPKHVAAVLAHEVAHIVLHRANLSLGVAADDEILTDCAAVAYGFGVISLDTYEVTETRHGNEIQHFERKLGYLTPEEMGFVVALCTRPAPSRFAFKSAAARQAYLWGNRYLRQHFGWPPLAWAPIYRRPRYLMHREMARRWSLATSSLRARQGYAFEGGDDGRVTFRCPLCAQGLRVPTRRAPTSVRCRSCKFAFDVSP